MQFSVLLCTMNLEFENIAVKWHQITNFRVNCLMFVHLNLGVGTIMEV